VDPQATDPGIAYAIRTDRSDLTPIDMRDALKCKCGDVLQPVLPQVPRMSPT
jgi:hypothetical protein